VADQTLVPCFVCGHADFRVLISPQEMSFQKERLTDFHQKRRQPGADLTDVAEFTQIENVAVVQCRECGTVLRNPQPTPRALRDRYRNDHYGFDVLDRLAANEGKFFDRLTRWLANFVPERANLVEIGSFVGAFLERAKAQGFHASGIDVGSETTAYMRSKGLPVIQGDVFELDSFRDLDAVCIWNTFDQINQPNRALASARKALREGGILALRIPNGRFLVSTLGLEPGRCDRAFAWMAFNNFVGFPYLCGYTPESLEWLLRRHGFAIQAMEGDTLVNNAGPETLDWAVEEERREKRTVERLCRLWQRQSGVNAFPWLNVIARAERSDLNGIASE
jgi:SAM-dependent methyltransferase